MNWYKLAQYDMYSQPLTFQEQTDVPYYDTLISDYPRTWHDPQSQKLQKRPIKDYMREVKNMTGNIEWMSPDEYIDEVARGFVVGEKLRLDSGKVSIPDFEDARSNLVDSRRTSYDTETGKNLIEDYKERWINGEQPPMGYLIYTKEGRLWGQEGLHRAIMAKDLGVSQIPVLIVRKNELV